VAFASASLLFKTIQTHRALDTEKNALVYTVVSTKLINGSPFNSISVVPGGAVVVCLDDGSPTAKPLERDRGLMTRTY
jgi:catabolite regulation protein CreA